MKKILLLACAAVVFSCSSDSDSSENNNNDSAVAYIKGKMDGTAFNYTYNNTVDDAYLYNANTGFSGLGFDRWYYYGGSVTTFNPPTFAPVFYISWNNMYFGAGGDEAGETAAFYDTVSGLPTNFLTEAQDDAHDPGIEIAYEAADGSFYTSKAGSQAGSTLAVSSYTEGSLSGQKIMTIVGTFTGKLYNSDDPTDVINVTNGSFKLILSEYQ